MEHDTPHGWLARAAERDPDAPALLLSDGVVSYADLDHQVTLRSGSLAGEVSTGEIVAVPVRLDLSSVVEILAVMRAGAVVFPYAGERPEVPAPAPRGTAMCLATSGSRGSPRLVPLSYDNLAASVAASQMRLGNGRGDRWLATLPLHHIGGLSVILRSLESGGAAVISPFDADTGSVIEAARPTIASLVPTMVHRLVERCPDQLASIGIVLTGGAKLGSALRRRAADRGITLVQTYGMTETSSQIATAVPQSAFADADLVGPVLDGFTVTIHAASGLAAPAEVGMIEVDGPAVFGGYLGEPERQGPHRTADLGYLDLDGMLGVVGRADDVVVTGGENVSLSRVSVAIEEIAGVRDVVVVGSPDPQWGTAICALVDLDPGVRSGDVLDELAGSLPPHAVPKRLRVGTVPLLGNGKHDIAAVQRIFDEE